MKENRSDIETWSIAKVLNRNILWKKHPENLH